MSKKVLKEKKGWQNVDKLYAEYKQAIQKNRIDCLKGIVYVGCKRTRKQLKCRQLKH